MKKMLQMIELSKNLEATQNLNISPVILDLCKELMSLIQRLIIDATALQEAIVQSGNMNNTLSPAEFYHKNSQWTDGFISASKAVGWAVKLLTDSADGCL